MVRAFGRIMAVLLWFVFVVPFHTSYQPQWELDATFDHLFEIPVLLLQEDGGNFTAIFRFTLRDMELNKTVTTFCQQQIIPLGMCNNLYTAAVKQRYDLLENKMIEDQLQQNFSTVNFQFIPNPHLQRRIVATTSEIDNKIKSANFSLQMEGAINQAFQSIHRALKPVLSRNNMASSLLQTNLKYSFHQNKRKPNLHELQLVVIHSCSLLGEESRVLASLLSSIVTTGLIQRRVHVIILNYGEKWNEQVLHPYVTHSRIHFIHVSDQISFFEIPTLIIMQKLSKLLVDQYSLPFSQILYLHTKGVSYSQIYPQIEDWRELMLYFLVEKHSMCYHLLASGEIDTVGVNFRTKGRDFRGNFWWVTAQYLSSLAPLSLVHHHKYDAEMWMLTATYAVRVFNAHESVIDHHHTRYARILYAPNVTTHSRPQKHVPHQASPMRWLDMEMMPSEQHITSYCRAKHVSWSKVDDILSAIVAQT